MSYDLTFEYPSPPLSLNQRLHPLAKARLTREVREDTNRLGQGIPAMQRCEVWLTWYVTDRRRRDEENPVPTLKAMCDELVTLGVVPDDTPEFMVKHMPRIEFTRHGPAHMVLSVSPLGPLPVDLRQFASDLHDAAVAA